MTEITRVPLQPVGKGSLTRLWLGVAVVVLLAALAAWLAAPKVQTLAGGVTVETIEAGEGNSPGATDFALVNYRGTLPDGTVFDEGQQTPMPVNQVVPGFSTALQAMQSGGRYRVQIPADQGYGSDVPPGAPIPPDTDLTFEVDLLEFRTQQEVMQMQQQMMQQQMMQQMMQQQGQGAAPGGLPGGQ
jgi:FKBP-type peptidyl-prolyl cis-trans isomerase FkpA